MDVIIVLVISIIGTVFCNLDFCTLHTLVGIAIALFRNWIDYTDDKTTRR